MSVQLEPHFPEARRVATTLRASGLQLAVAESCTGGLLGAVLTTTPGASDHVMGGVIAYSNALKTSLLGVDRRLIAEHGAVSREVAEAMAEGVRRATGAGVGVGITGVAGPDGSEGKRPGLVFVAVATERGVQTERLDDDHGREGNRDLAVRTALRLIAEAVERR